MLRSGIRRKGHVPCRRRRGSTSAIKRDASGLGDRRSSFLRAGEGAIACSAAAEER